MHRYAKGYSLFAVVTRHAMKTALSAFRSLIGPYHLPLNDEAVGVSARTAKGSQANRMRLCIHCFLKTLTHAMPLMDATIFRFPVPVSNSGYQKS